MTIQRQYSLPNCRLVLEGWGDDAAGTSASGRPAVSMLVNAECHFAGHDQPLSGGREFLENLVTAVSQYAQEVLSGVTHPQAHNNGHGQPKPVHLQKVAQDMHRLTIYPEVMGNGHTPTEPVQLDLRTVQLFDLVEAVDQFFADTQTLPDLALNVAPVSKRHVITSEPVTQRVLPAAIGISSLAVAAAALFFLPVPEVRRPEPAAEGQEQSVEGSPTTPVPVSNGGDTPPDQTAETPPNETDLEALLATAPAITDPQQLSTLTQALRDELDLAWVKEPTFDEDLVYRVGVAENGDILGFKYTNDASLEYVNDTPLLDLRYMPVDPEAAVQEPVGEFRVVFRPNGVLEVSPWDGQLPNSSTESSTGGGSTVTDAEELQSLTRQLQSQIFENLQARVAVGEELTYQVQFNQQNQIVDLEAMNQSARDYFNETPLADLQNRSKSASSDPQSPQALFRVVFTETGVLEVSPWHGYP